VQRIPVFGMPTDPAPTNLDQNIKHIKHHTIKSNMPYFPLPKMYVLYINSPYNEQGLGLLLLTITNFSIK
jgi:hypothetical protein